MFKQFKQQFLRQFPNIVKVLRGIIRLLFLGTFVLVAVSVVSGLIFNLGTVYGFAGISYLEIVMEYTGDLFPVAIFVTIGCAFFALFLALVRKSFAVFKKTFEGEEISRSMGMNIPEDINDFEIDLQVDRLPVGGKGGAKGGKKIDYKRKVGDKVIVKLDGPVKKSFEIDAWIKSRSKINVLLEDYKIELPRGSYTVRLNLDQLDKIKVTKIEFRGYSY